MADKSSMYRNLHQMLSAGLPVVQAFRMAGRGMGSLSRACRAVSEQLREGRQIAEAMGTHPSVFGLLDVTVVHAGEESGNLPGSFAMLAQWYEFRRRLRRQVQAGSYLPLMLLHAMAVLLPVISVSLGSFSGQRPDYMLIPHLVLRNLLLIWVPLGLIWGIFAFTSEQSPIRRGLDRLLLYVPLVGGAMRQLAWSRYFWAFHVLAKAGMDAVQSSLLAARVAGNSVVARQLKRGTASARAGNPISEGLLGVLPDEYIEILQVGEQTGEAEESARRLGELASQRAASRLNALTTWLPRLVYLGLALYVAYVILKVASGYANVLNDLMRGI